MSERHLECGDEPLVLRVAGKRIPIRTADGSTVGLLIDVPPGVVIDEPEAPSLAFDRFAAGRQPAAVRRPPSGGPSAA